MSEELLMHWNNDTGENPVPTEKDLDYIRNWEFRADDDHYVLKFIDYLQSFWRWESYFTVTGKNIKRLDVSTGGWSDHERIIEALKESDFWMLFWESSRRGGHYKFRVPLRIP